MIINVLLVVTYDVDTTNKEGEHRLRKVAQLCERYGMRVQNSVFEVLLDAAQLTTLECELEKIIEPDVDSIRIYRLGNSYKNKIEVMGKTSVLQAGEPLLL